MARGGLEFDDGVPEFLTGDVGELRQGLRSDRPDTASSFRPMPKPPNPTDPRGLSKDFMLMWQEALPQIEQNSDDAGQYAENLKRVLRALFRRQHGDDPSPEEWRALQFMLDLPMFLHGNQPTQQKLNRREELQNYQRDFQEGR